MVTFILGRSGSGKTELIHKIIRDRGSFRKTLLIVPEQSSFLNEKKLLAALGAKGARDIEVLSFRRLCDFVFEHFGGITDERIDDGCKAVLMSRAIDSCCDSAELLVSSKRRKSALIDPMLTAVNEYKMCLITPEMLTQASKGVSDPQLGAKLRDSAVIYAAYNALLENTYSDPDDDLTRMCAMLDGEDYFADMRICFDSFTGFSAQEMQVIRCILQSADDIYFSLCVPSARAVDNTGIFSEPGETLQTLMRLSRKAGHECRISDETRPGLRYKSDSIAAVEQGVFSGFRSDELQHGKNDGSVCIYEADDIYDEVRYIASRILHLVNDCGYRYSDIEIITRRPELYKNAVDSEFPKYGIPYFLSSSQSLASKPLVRLILAGFEAVRNGYETGAVLRYAGSGLTGLTQDEVFLLENYAYVWSISGKRWRRPFTMPPDDRKRSAEDAARETERIEQARQKLISPLEELEQSLDEAENGAQITEALYGLIESCGARKAFRRSIEAIRKAEGAACAQREASVWDMVMEILSRLHNLMKDDKGKSEHYYELLRLYIKKSSLSEIPRTVNSVTIGTAGAIRSDAPRAVFVPGCVSGEFPARVSSVGIFTDSERRFLRDERSEDERLPLYGSAFDAALKEKFAAYSALSSPAEKLFVSYYTRSASGSPGEPSVIIQELLRCLPDTVIMRSPALTGEDVPPAGQLFTERQGFDRCAALWNESTALSAALRRYYEKSEVYCDRVQALERASDGEAMHLHDLKLARKLYGVPLQLSSTKLNSFADCRFSYFCRFGLHASPLKKASMDSSLFGTAMHYIFEKFLGEGAPGAVSGVSQLLKADEAAISRSVHVYMDMYLDELGSTGERSERFSALCSKVCANAVRVLLRMKQQYSVDIFRPADFELAIGGENADIPALTLELPSGEKIILTGYVDRVDTADIDGERFIRIIDYKTGNTKFSFRNLAGGLNIQMLLYLSAILRNGSTRYGNGTVSLPAGVLYVPSAAVSSVAKSGDEQSKLEAVNEQNTNFKMNGLLLDDVRVISAMNSGLDGQFIPPVMTKSGAFDKRYGSVVTAEQFEKIFEYVDVCVKHMAQELFSGSIEAFPMSGACIYCDFSSVCRFEQGTRTNKLPHLDKEAALKRINEVLSEIEVKKDEQ